MRAFFTDFAKMFGFCIALIVVTSAITIGPIALLIHLQVPAFPFGMPIAFSFWAFVGAVTYAVLKAAERR